MSLDNIFFLCVCVCVVVVCVCACVFSVNLSGCNQNRARYPSEVVFGGEHSAAGDSQH